MADIPIEVEKCICIGQLELIEEKYDAPLEIQTRVYQIIDVVDETECFGQAADHLVDTRELLIEEYAYSEGDDLLVSLAGVEQDLEALFARTSGDQRKRQ